MNAKPGAPLSLPVQVELLGATPDDKLDELQAVLFDRNGARVAAAALKVQAKGESLVAEGALSAQPEQLQSGRLVVAPMYRGEKGREPLSRARLEKQLRGYTEPLQLDLREPRAALRIPRPYWEHWPRLCACWIRGRLIKRVWLPDGRVLDLPICHARVTICEVDRWPLVIARLPWLELKRLRDDLLDVLRVRPPIPEPEPEPFPHALAGMHIQPDIAPRALRAPAQAAHAQRTLQLSDASAAALRADLLANIEVLRPYLCWLPWLERWFAYTKQCFGPITTDEQGRFSFLYVHDCRDADQPDIYVSAEQFIGGNWTTIHKPPVRCHTVWNYRCGDEITVVVSDPRALPCVPDVPVDPPPGVDNWVMPMAIGGTWIRGTAAVGPTPAGWVRPDGMTDYGSVVNAPFGATLGFRQQHSLSIPNPGQYYYRWSFRRDASDPWTTLLDPVSRTYVRDVPGPGVQFPAVLLGPQPGQVFRFRPALFNPADWGVSTAGDPAGTQYYWPVDNSIGDIYAARWTTPGTTDAVAAPSLAGSYQVRLEVLDSAKNVVAPGPGTFTFVVPQAFSGDTLETRAANTVSEIIDNAFVFTVFVDNSRCTADIHAPTVSSGVGADDCGFLRYTPGTSVTLSFDALHPHQRATFSFTLTRGAYAVPAAGASGEVGAASVPPYAGPGSFSHAFPVGELLGPVPGHAGTCVNAAFAQTLHVDAKATDGNHRIHAYDADDVRAFALAQEVPPM